MTEEKPSSEYLESPLAKARRLWNLEELKKLAQAKGIPLEKLVTQMVEQYLREDRPEAPRA
jgi:hypothetical protein